MKSTFAGVDLVSDEFADTVRSSLQRVENLLLAELSSGDEVMTEAATHLAKAGGKRFRPMFAILAAQFGPRPDSDDVITSATVVEMIHLATLYHDDVMDEAPVRRGAPAAHRLWGNSAAILAGDLIFARASQLMSELGMRPVRVQADTFERLVQGQLWETQGPAEGADPVEHYYRVLAGKTGSLIAAAGMLGALLGGADEEAVQVMSAYGEKVGLAFQLADDLIDLTGTAEQIGKTPGTDLRERVPTLTTLLLDRAAAGEGPDAQEARRVRALVDGPLDTDEQLAAAVAALTAHPAIDEAWAVTRAWVDDAKQALAPLPDSVVKTSLEGFADYVVERSA